MHQEYEPCLARVRIFMEFLTWAHLASGQPAQKTIISLPFPKEWPQHFPTSQPAAPLMLCLLTPHSGLRDVVTPRYTITPHQWHNPPPCPSPPSPAGVTQALLTHPHWNSKPDAVCVCARAGSLEDKVKSGPFFSLLSLSPPGFWEWRSWEGALTAENARSNPPSISRSVPEAGGQEPQVQQRGGVRKQACLLKPISQWWEPKRTGQGERSGGHQPEPSGMSPLPHPFKAFLSTDYVLRS